MEIHFKEVNSELKILLLDTAIIGQNPYNYSDHGGDADHVEDGVVVEVPAVAVVQIAPPNHPGQHHASREA